MSELSVHVQHRFGPGDQSFYLDCAFSVQRWPAVLFGPSGAGKSSLLRIIAGLERPFSAHVVWDGKPLRPAAPPSHVQLVSQRPSLFPHLDVARNVGFGIAHLPAKARRDRVQEMLDLLGATHLAERMPGRLSGGERQRVAIARALAVQPRLLLLDEAFAGLDQCAKLDLFTRVSALLHARNTAAVYVTHEVSDAFVLDAEVIVLSTGRVVAQGPAHSVLAKQRERLLAAISPSRETIVAK